MKTKRTEVQDLADIEVNKRLGKLIAKREKEIRKFKAKIRKLNKEIKKIEKGEWMPDSVSSAIGEKLIVFLLDESGSMSSYINETIEGFNAYIKKMIRSNLDIKFTLAKFDSDGIRTVCEQSPISEVPLLSRDNYRPGTLTPLFDAIGKMVSKHRKNRDVLFIIQTDGYENDSKEFKIDSIKKLIKRYQNDNKWEFVYIGADIDAWGNEFSGGHVMGLNTGNTMSYKGSDSRHFIGSGLACHTTTYLCCSAADSYETGNFFSTNSTVSNDKKRVTTTDATL